MLRVAVVEDDRLYSDRLVQYLKQYGEETGEEIRTTVFFDGMEIAEGYQPVWDVILLDIEMPLLDGMTTAQRIRAADTSVILIFITNMAQYAIRGYEVDAMDFVLKPINYFAFRMKMHKARRILGERPTACVILHVEGESRKVPVSAIRYVEVADHRLVYHTTMGDFSEFGSLKELESSLGNGFCRCNHCFLVHLKYVDGIKGDSAVVGQEELKISRAKKREFVQRLSDYYRFGGR